MDQETCLAQRHGGFCIDDPLDPHPLLSRHQLCSVKQRKKARSSKRTCFGDRMKTRFDICPET